MAIEDNADVFTGYTDPNTQTTDLYDVKFPSFFKTVTRKFTAEDILNWFKLHHKRQRMVLSADVINTVFPIVESDKTIPIQMKRDVIENLVTQLDFVEKTKISQEVITYINENAPLSEKEYNVTSDEEYQPSVPGENGDPELPNIPLKYGKVTFHEVVGNNGTISGSATQNVEVTINEGNIQLSPADTSIGRNYDAYWFGIWIEAPEGFGAEELANATMTYPDGQTGLDKTMKFLDVKDRDFAVGSFIGVTEEEVNGTYQTAQDGEVIKTRTYRLDWKGDGSHTQTVKVDIVKSDKISFVGPVTAELVDDGEE